MWFRKYKDQYIQNLRLAAPVILSQVGQVLVQLADSAMVGQLTDSAGDGRIGALSLAAVSFGSGVFFLLFIFGIGISLALTPLVGEMYAKREHRTAATYLQNAIILYSLIGVVIFGLLYIATPLLYHMGQPTEVVDIAIPYYKYVVWSVIPFMLFAAFKQFLEGVGNTKVAMVIVIISNLVNIFFNYLLIYGNWGFPQMGAAGAGLATLISRIITPILIILYFVHNQSLRRYLSMFSWGRVQWRWIVSLLKVGFPISIQMLMEGGAFVLASIMMGWIGATEIAANQIALNMANCSFMVLIGVSAATTIRVSHEFGRGNLEGIKRSATASYHIGIVYNLLAATIFIALRNYIPLLFTSDPEVIRVASNLLIFLALLQVSDGMQVISLGILRGMQDVSITMLIAFVSYIVINLPLGYLLAFTFNMGASGLWISFVFGLSVAAILLYVRFRRNCRRMREASVEIDG